MKVAILTLTGYFNYGNRLQNYASQEVLKELGCEVETIPVEFKNWKRDVKNLIGLLNLYFPILNNKKLNELSKEYKFYKFTRKNIKYSSYYLSSLRAEKDINNLIINYDYFLTGSDQVFNPFFGDIDIFYLSFVPNEKRLSYAASFGISDIPGEYSMKIGQLLKGFKAISVREDTGIKLVKELSERDATLLIDPTMMLSKDKWLKISKKPWHLDEKKYILTYVLGNVTEEFNNFVNKIAKEKALDIINILEHKKNNLYTCDPGEFIYLINSAEIMITDSFHGAVFSIIMQTPFVIFNREDENVSMNSRIETLTQTFKMTDRISNNINKTEDLFNMDFKESEQILKREQDKAIEFLKNNLNI